MYIYIYIYIYLLYGRIAWRLHGICMAFAHLHEHHMARFVMLLSAAALAGVMQAWSGTRRAMP